MTPALTGLVLALVVGSSWAYFGSMAASLAYIRGARLLSTASARDFGRIAAGTTADVTIDLRNHAGRPITLLGSRASCTCVMAETLPRTIAPGERSDLHITIDGTRKTGPIAEHLTLYTDLPGQPELAFRIVGEVSARPEDRP